MAAKKVGVTQLTKQLLNEKQGKVELKKWTDVISDGFGVLQDVILEVDKKGIGLRGAQKKSVVIHFLMKFINIPFVPKSIEVQIWSILIDILFHAWRSEDPTRTGKANNIPVATEPEEVQEEFLEEVEESEEVEDAEEEKPKNPTKGDIVNVLKLSGEATAEAVVNHLKTKGFSEDSINNKLSSLIGKGVERVGDKFKVSE